MPIPIDIVLRVLGLDKVQQGARQMASDIRDATSKVSKDFEAASTRVERLEKVLKKRPHDLALTVAVGEARKLRDELKDTATQAVRTNRAIQDIKSRDIHVRFKGANALAGAYQDNKSKFSPLQDTLGEARNAGLGAVAIGGAGAFAIGRATLGARQFERKRGAIMSYQGGDKLFQDLLDMDKRSPFDINELAGGAQSALAMGFDTSEIIPLFDTLGDQVVKAGKGMEEFNAALRQIMQIRTKGKAEMQDINALAEGGGIPVIPILKKALGNDRVKDIMSGDKPITAEELFPVLFKGMKEISGGEMAKAMETLPGQVENLTGQLNLLSIELAQNLLPTAKVIVGAVSGVTGFFRSLPGPLKWIIAHGAAVNIALITIGGGLLTLVSQIGLARIALTGLTGTAGLPALATGMMTMAPAATGAAGAITGVLIPALTVALPAAAAIAGALIAAKLTDSILNTPLEKAAKGVETSSGRKPDGTKEYLLAEADAKRKAVEEIDKRAAERKTGTPWWARAMASVSGVPGVNMLPGVLDFASARNENELRRGDAAERKTLSMEEARLRRQAANAPSALTQVGGASSAVLGWSAMTGGGGNPDAPSYQPQIRALEDKIRATKDKEEKAKLSAELVQLRRAEQDRKAAVAAAGKAEREATRNARIGGGMIDERLESTLRIGQARSDAAARLAAIKEDSALQQKIRAIEARAEAGQLEEVEAQNQIARLQAAHDKRRKHEEAAHRVKVASIEAQSIMAQATAEAAGRSAAEVKAIMDKARVKAGEVKELAALEAGVLRAEGNAITPDLKTSKRGRLNAFLAGGGSLLTSIGGLAGMGGNTGSIFGMRSGNYGDGGAFTRTIGANVKPLENLGAIRTDRNIELAGKRETGNFTEYTFTFRHPKGGMGRAGRAYN